MTVFYVFDDFGEFITTTTDEEKARALAEEYEGYYCTDED
jgi:hypothetical protein